jgi:1-acyl-sn-glycerol-3-phosphate acyltransferase
MVGLGDIVLSIRGLILLVPWLVYLGIIDLILSALLPVSWFFPNWVQNVSSALAFTVWNWIQVIFEYCNGGEIVLSGDDLPQEESAIVIANHVSWTDFYMIQSLAVRSGMLSRCRWFAKIQLRWVPFLGWGIWAMGMPMVSRNWMKDQKELDRVFSGVVDQKWPTCTFSVVMCGGYF